jgi:hypothetical protein
MTAMLAPPQGVILTASPSQTLSTVELPIFSDADIAWWLAEAADEVLMGHQRTMTFVELGCGEHFLAIIRIINAVASSRMTLPVAIFDRLDSWLNGYAGSPEEPRLRSMIAEIRQRQCGPVRLHTEQLWGAAGQRLARCRVAY